MVRNLLRRCYFHPRHLTIGIGVLLVFAAGCAEQAPVTTAPLDVWPSFDYFEEEDCQLGPVMCLAINSAINHLQGHAVSGCRAVGNVARMRFNAVGYGFRPGDNVPDERAYVMMQPDSSYSSGWGPTDNNTFVNNIATAMPFDSLGGVIAHEERHQSGADNPDHGTGVGYQTEALCS